MPFHRPPPPEFVSGDVEGVPFNLRIGERAELTTHRGVIEVVRTEESVKATLIRELPAPEMRAASIKHIAEVGVREALGMMDQAPDVPEVLAAEAKLHAAFRLALEEYILVREKFGPIEDD